MRFIAGLIVFALLVWAAGPAGVWKGELTMTDEDRRTTSEARLALVVNGSKLTGTLTANGAADEILNGSVRQGIVSFVIATGMDDINSLHFRGSVNGDSLTLQIRQGPDENGNMVNAGSAHFRRAK